MTNSIQATGARPSGNFAQRQEGRAPPPAPERRAAPAQLGPRAGKTYAGAAVFALAAVGMNKLWGAAPRIQGDAQRFMLRNDVRNRYADLGGVDFAPQSECIKSLTKSNPVTNPSYNPFGDLSGDMFEAFESRRQEKEQSAGAYSVKMDGERAAWDRELNVRYLTEQEREACVVSANVDGAMVDVNGNPLTPGFHIVVIGEDDKIYTSPDTRIGAVHHSSFLGGAPVKFAGVLLLDKDAKPTQLENASGHYKPPAYTLLLAGNVFHATGIDTKQLYLLEHEPN